MRHVSASAWDNAFINFDQSSWFAAPNYVVMQLWRNHFAPNRIALEGSSPDINTVATKSQDGRTLYFKCVNTGKSPAEVSLSLEDGRSIATATMQLIAPGSLLARNTLDQPEAITAKPVVVKIIKGEAHFHLPALSASVVVLKP